MITISLQVDKKQYVVSVEKIKGFNSILPAYYLASVCIPSAGKIVTQKFLLEPNQNDLMEFLKRILSPDQKQFHSGSDSPSEDETSEDDEIYDGNDLMFVNNPNFRG